MNCSKNWFLTVGNGTGSSVTTNTEVGRYLTTDDRFGKEIVVGMTAQAVAIWKNNDSYNLQFRGFLVTSTSTDCTGAFVWSNLVSSWSTSPTMSVQGTVKATIGDCAITHTATLDDGSPLPVFVTYDV